jgi:hypothetical protein
MQTEGENNLEDISVEGRTKLKEMSKKQEEVVESIYLLQKSNHWLDLVKRAMHFRVPQNTGSSCLAEPLPLSQERICSTELN